MRWITFADFKQETQTCVIHHLSVDDSQQKIRISTAAQHLAQFEAGIQSFQLFYHFLRWEPGRTTETTTYYKQLLNNDFT